MSIVHRLDVYVSPDDSETIKRLAMKIRPEWTSQKDLKLKDMSSGYINHNVCCYQTSVDDGLFFRMLSEEGTLVDIAEAIRVVDFLHTQELCAPLRMVFENGYCVDFIKGDALTWATRRRQYEPEIRRAIANEMARYHSQKAYHVAQEYGVREEFSFLTDDLIEPCWKYMQTDEKLDQSLIKSIPTLDEFKAERDLVIRMMTDITLEKAFSHTDINPSNIIITDDGNLTTPDFTEYPDDEYRNQWLLEYLQHQWEIDGRQRPLTKTIFNLLKYHVSKVHLWAILEFMYAMLFVLKVGPPAHASGDGMLRSAKKCWDYYLLLRDDLMALTLEDTSTFSMDERTVSKDENGK